VKEICSGQTLTPLARHRRLPTVISRICYTFYRGIFKIWQNFVFMNSYDIFNNLLNDGLHFHYPNLLRLCINNKQKRDSSCRVFMCSICFNKFNKLIYFESDMQRKIGKLQIAKKNNVNSSLQYIKNSMFVLQVRFFLKTSKIHVFNITELNYMNISYHGNFVPGLHNLKERVKNEA
jgi:hypothetical protein